MASTSPTMQVKVAVNFNAARQDFFQGFIPRSTRRTPPIVSIGAPSAGGYTSPPTSEGSTTPLTFSISLQIALTKASSPPSKNDPQVLRREVTPLGWPDICSRGGQRTLTQLSGKNRFSDGMATRYLQEGRPSFFQSADHPHQHPARTGHLLTKRQPQATRYQQPHLYQLLLPSSPRRILQRGYPLPPLPHPERRPIIHRGQIPQRHHRPDHPPPPQRRLLQFILHNPEEWGQG